MTATGQQDTMPAAGASEPDPAGRSRHGRRRRSLVALGLGLVLAAVLALVLVPRKGPAGPDVAPGINQASAAVLALQVLGRAATFPAPDFHLVDQHGQPFSLRQFRGDSVVLSFNDDQCPDLCTLLAQAIVAAQHDLAGSHVVFVAVNVNPFFPQVDAVRQWSDHHGLGNVRSWHFGTAAVATLQQIWHAYGVDVQTDPATKTVVHASPLFFIDPTGTTRAVGDFGLDAADTRYFAHAMSQMAVDLLPPPQRRQVGGPVTPPPAPGNVSPGSPAPRFDLPLSSGHGKSVTLGMESGKPTVLTFWSPSCGPCVSELPALQAAHHDLGDKVNFVGIDVAGQAGSASSTAHRLGVRFTLAEDPGNAAASAYHVVGTPYSFIVGPTGTIKTVHPGPLTAEQVEYELKSLFPGLAPGGS